MAAISNHISPYPIAVRRDAVLVAWRLIFWSPLRDVMSRAFRQGLEILFALWMFAVLAFSLLIAARFVV